MNEASVQIIMNFRILARDKFSPDAGTGEQLDGSKLVY